AAIREGTDFAGLRARAAYTDVAGVERRAIRIEVCVTGWVGNDIGDADSCAVVHRIGHLIPVHELTAGGVTGDDNGLDVWKSFFVRQPAEYPVGEIERGQLGIVARHAAGAPAVAVARPVDFVR